MQKQGKWNRKWQRQMTVKLSYIIESNKNLSK